MHPGRDLGAWWDFHGYEDYLDDPTEAAWLASHARIWLEELTHAGSSLDERPTDADGVAWGQMDWVPDRAETLPPHLLNRQ